MSGDEIVVTGISGIFPNSENVQEFMENLYNQVDMIVDDPAWTVTSPEMPRHAGRVKGMDRFDAQFFKVSYHQAKAMEPMSKKLLEHAYGAIFDSGNSQSSLEGTTIGVFIGSSYADFSATSFYDINKRSDFVVSGTSKSMYANRISYWVDGRGPSFCLDNSCTGSCAALELAVQNIKTGKCDAAVVGACNLCTKSTLTMNVKRAGLICLDGKTKCFDKNADGGVRSDAINLVFLQKAKDAKRIYAELCHVEGSYQLKDNEPFSPARRPDDLVCFLNDVYSNTDVDPKNIEYIEANGAALLEADENEVQAIANFFAKENSVKIGCVKSNMGNSDSVSGLCGLTKLCLAYHTGLIPGNLHCQDPVQPASGGTIKVVTKNTEFARGYSALNNFSFTGMNYHAVLKGHYKEKNLDMYKSGIPRIVVASGRQESCVRRILDELKNKRLDAEEIALLHNIFAHDINGHISRGYVVLDSIEEKTVTLSDHVNYYPGVRPPLWFVFSGMGSQWPAMGADLMRIPTFAKTIQKCDECLSPLGIDIVKVLTEPDQTIFDSTINSFVGISALQIGLIDVLKELGVKPDYIIGHSLGEMACAYQDDTLTLEELILGTYSRGKTMQESDLIPGCMAAVGLGYKDLVKQCPPEIDIACRNSEASSTISGPTDAVQRFVDELTSRGVFSRAVKTANIAYHSRYVADVGPILLKRLKCIFKDPKERSARWISTSVPKERLNEYHAKYSTAEYHTNNVLNPVLFEDAIAQIPSNAVVVEIAPHALMQAILKKSLKECTHIPLTKRDNLNGVQMLLDAIGKLYVAGYNPKVEALYPAVQFPVSTETPLLSHLVQWEHSEEWPLLTDDKYGESPISRNVVFSLHDDDYMYLAGYVRNGVNVLPEAALLSFVWETLADYKNTNFQDMSVVFSDIKFHSEVFLTVENPVKLNVMISKGSNNFEVTQEDKAIVSGTIREANNLQLYQTVDDINNHEECLTTENIYKILRMRGCDHKGKFQSIFSSNLNCNKALIKWTENWVPFLDALIQLNTISKEFNGISKPKLIRQLKISVSEHEKATCKMQNGMKCYPASLDDIHGTTRCAGIEIADIRYNETLLENHCTNSLESNVFFPFYPTEAVDIKTAMDINMQLILDNCLTQNINIISCGGDIIPEEFKCINEVIAKTALVIGKVITVRDNRNINELLNNEKFDHETKETNVIVLKNLLQSSKEMKSLQNRLECDTFVLSVEDKIPSEPSLLKNSFSVLSCMSDGIKIIVLMKPMTLEQSIYIPIEFDETFSWVPNVYDKLQSKERIVLISEKQKHSGILGFVRRLRSDGYNNISALIIDDPYAPKFDPNHESYKDQIQKNMTFNILKKNQWGSHYFKSSKRFVKQSNFALKQRRIGEKDCFLWTETSKESGNNTSVQVSYSGITKSDCVGTNNAGKESPSLGMDFSGIDKNGDKVMGLVAGGSVATSVEADPHLLWRVPDHWTLEDAATVPAAFVQAYYCLERGSAYTAVNRILILDGTSDVALALISLCLSLKYDIYTEVQNEHNMKALLTLYPQLNESNINCSDKEHFFDFIMRKTGGGGADLVVNFAPGTTRQEAAKCVGNFGNYLDFSKNDMYENAVLGMKYIAGAKSYTALDIASIFRSEYIEDRKRLQGYITEGIRTGVVKPLSRLVFSPLQIDEALKVQTANQHFGKVVINIKEASVKSGLPIVPRISYAPQDVVILVCDEEGVGIELADQLIERGVRRLVLHLKVKATGYQRAKFVAWSKQEVFLKLCTDNLQNTAGSGALVKKAMDSGKVKGVFVVSDSQQTDNGTTEDSIKLKKYFINAYKELALVLMNLDVATRNGDLSHFVVLARAVQSAGNECALSVAEAVCDTRCEMGLPSLLLRYNSSVKINDDESKIDEINPQKVADIFNAIETSLKLKHRSVQAVDSKKKGKKKHYNNDTPAGLLNFYRHVELEQDDVISDNIVELPSLVNDGSVDDWTANDPYVILIPGFEGRPQIFESMAERLKLRAISVKLSPDLEEKSIQDIAYFAREQLKRLGDMSSRIFHILGYSFGANVALELAAMLETEGHVGVVYCVDGSPDAMRTIIDLVLGDISEENLQNVVINHMQNLIKPENKEMKAKDNFGDIKLDYYDTKGGFLIMNKEMNCSTQYKKIVLESAYKRITMTKKYNTTMKLKSVIVLIKSTIHKATNSLEDDYGLSKYTKQPVKVFELATDHVTAPQDGRLSNIVNSFTGTNADKNNKRR